MVANGLEARKVDHRLCLADLDLDAANAVSDRCRAVFEQILKRRGEEATRCIVGRNCITASAEQFRQWQAGPLGLHVP